MLRKSQSAVGVDCAVVAWTGAGGLLNDPSELLPLYEKIALIQAARAALAVQSGADVGEMFVCDVVDHAVLKSKWILD